MESKTVAVALSGGVDSLVSGFLIKQQYKEVFGIHFTTGRETASVDTGSIETQLGFPVHSVDLSRVFEREVVDYFTRAYMSGKTPNPCLICNLTIKFGALLKYVQSLGAQAIATGHYATVVNAWSNPELEGKSYLMRGSDPQKDQSYFLSMLSHRTLDHLIFPLAGICKEEVRRIAAQNGLAPAVPRESQDICFIPQGKFPDFIQKQKGVIPRPGPIVDHQGHRVGQHPGLHQFTIGQRRGINIPAERPYYVSAIDMEHNTLHVCFKEELSCLEMEVAQVNWNDAYSTQINDITTQIRYGHKGTLSDLTLSSNGTTGRVRFHVPQNAVTPGQAAVFYRGDRILGAGIIQ